MDECFGPPHRRQAILARCALPDMQNRTYLGEIVHKGQSHPGEHTPIDQLLWDAAQAQLAGNTAERNSGTRTRQPSLLTGMLFDANGNPMTPSHAVKQGTRYRYYVSRPLIIKDQTKSSAGLRIPAEEIEPLVPAACANGFQDVVTFHGILRARPRSEPRVAPVPQWYSLTCACGPRRHGPESTVAKCLGPCGL